MKPIRNNAQGLCFLVFVLFPFMLQGQSDSRKNPKVDFSKYEKTISDEDFYATFYDSLGYESLVELVAQENVFTFNRFSWYKVLSKSISERFSDLDGIGWLSGGGVKASCHFYVLDSTGHYVAPYYRVVFNPRKKAKLGYAVDRYLMLYGEMENAQANGLKTYTKEYQELEKKLEAARKLMIRYAANYGLPIRKWNSPPPAWLYTE